MVFKCAAPGCKTGYGNIVPEGVSLHSFPQDQELRKKWINAIKRKDYTPGASAKICSLHFPDSDFIQEHTDSNVTRKRKYGQRIRKKLKESVVPSIFPNLPSYMSKPPNISRPSTSTSTSRLEKENLQIMENIRKFEDANIIDNLDTLKDKVCTAALPGNFREYPSSGENLIFTNAIESDEFLSILSYVIVKPDLSFTAYKNGIRCDEKNFASQMKYCRKLMDFTDFMNLLAFLCSDEEGPVISPIPNIVSMLESYAEAGTLSCHECQKLEFLTEQLMLLDFKPHRRRYSKATLVVSIILQSYSTAAYSALSKHNCLTLPSLSSLRRITKGFHVENSKEMVEYLKSRRSGLNDYESVVSLIFDEIYIYETMEYSAGRFFGKYPGTLS